MRQGREPRESDELSGLAVLRGRLLAVGAVGALTLLRLARGGPEAASPETAETETATAVGPRFRRGPREPDPVDRGPAPRVARALPSLAGLGLVAALVPANDVWAAQAALLVLLLTLPGALLLRALRVPRRAVAGFPAYVPCASIVVLLSAGLAVDLIGQAVGIAEPLRAVPLLVGLEAVGLGLVVAGLHAPPEAGVSWAALPRDVRIAWPLLLPLLAAAGAVLFTGGHGRGVAVASVALAVAALVVCVVRARSMSNAHLAVVLFGVGLALIWSFTLRGRFLYGFDVATEFQVVDFTFVEGIWRTGHEDDAYGAMLSLTVLPGLFQGLTGISGLLLLKVVYPALFALFPVAVLGFARRFVSARMAFVAGAFLVAQAYFFQLMPAIARQEIALLVFVALLAAILDRRIAPRPRWSFAVLLALALVVSHYATTYLTITTLAAALVVQFAISYFRPLPRLSIPFAVALAATALGATAWYGAITHSSGNLSDFSADVRDRGLDFLPNARKGQSLVQTYLQGNAPRRMSARSFEEEVRSDYRDERPYVKPWVAAFGPDYELVDSRPRADRRRVAWLVDGLRGLQVLASQLANVLAIIGTLLLALRRRTGPLTRQLAMLGLGTLAVLAVVRLSGTAAEAYNQERAFLQTMVSLGIGLAWTLELLASRGNRIGRAVPVAAALAIAVMAFAATGLRGVVLGGGTPTNLASAGEDYERFYVTPAELAGARWTYQVPRDQLLYADRYGELRVQTATGRSDALLHDLTPETLDRDAWIYASRTNLEDDRARGYLGGRFATYRWPGAFIRSHYDLVYTNGASAVYLGDLAGRDKPR